MTREQRITMEFQEGIQREIGEEVMVSYDWIMDTMTVTIGDRSIRYTDFMDLASDRYCIEAFVEDVVRWYQVHKRMSAMV